MNVRKARSTRCEQYRWWSWSECFFVNRMTTNIYYKCPKPQTSCDWNFRYWKDFQVIEHSGLTFLSTGLPDPWTEGRGNQESFEKEVIWLYLVLIIDGCGCSFGDCHWPTISLHSNFTIKIYKGAEIYQRKHVLLIYRELLQVINRRKYLNHAFHKVVFMDQLNALHYTRFFWAWSYWFFSV